MVHWALIFRTLNSSVFAFCFDIKLITKIWFGLAYLFNAISTYYGVFNAKYRFISRYFITLNFVFNIPLHIYLPLHILFVGNYFCTQLYQSHCFSYYYLIPIILKIHWIYASNYIWDAGERRKWSYFLGSIGSFKISTLYSPRQADPFSNDQSLVCFLNL